MKVDFDSIFRARFVEVERGELDVDVMAWRSLECISAENVVIVNYVLAWALRGGER